MASKGYDPLPDCPSKVLPAGELCRIHVYRGGEVRVEFDARPTKIPATEEQLALLSGHLSMFLLEMTGWCVQQSAAQKTLRRMLEEMPDAKEGEMH